MTDPLYRRHRDGLPAQILDLLDIDPGWWTTSAIVHRFSDHRPETVKRALQRLDVAGLVRSRPRSSYVWVGHAENEYAL